MILAKVMALVYLALGAIATFSAISGFANDNRTMNWKISNLVVQGVVAFIMFYAYRAVVL